MTVLLIIIAALLALSALVCMFLPRPWCAGLAWGAMLLIYFAGIVPLEWTSLVFWGVAALLVYGIGFLSGGESRVPVAPNAYVAAGAIVGGVVGMVIATAGIILGAVIGAFFGALAFSRTPGGRGLGFPSAAFNRLLLDSGLAAVVTVSILLSTI